MPIDLGSIKLPIEIPGFITEFELIYLALLSKYIPKNKKILEIGSLFGRSSLAFLLNSHESVILNTIDPFETYGNVKGWEEEHFSIIHCSDKHLKEIAKDLTRKNKRFFEAFDYFTKEYRESKRLLLRRENSQDSSFNEQVEVMFVDGDHYIVTQDVTKFHYNVDGLIIIHDFTSRGDYGYAVFSSCIECGNLLNLPFIVFPMTSFVFFCKTDGWKNILFQVFEEAKKLWTNWSH